ncbi:hypothetical protein [Flavobacterium pedocola]
MKANQKYVLNENLDLEDEIFLVKKGSLLEITKLYDATDNSIPTNVGIRFDNMHGHYVMNEMQFEKLEKKKIIQAIQPAKYQVGDCVTHTTFGQGSVDSVWYDSFMKFYLYRVTFTHGPMVTTEKEIQHC